jgi:SGNH hydrolase-like domain, acetyltransferase AlgX
VPIDRRAHITVAAVFLAVIMAPGLIQTVTELGHGEQPRALDVFLEPPTARNLHTYEQSLEKTSLVVKQLRPWMQYLEWRFLADAGEKVVVGRDGWLFYRPSVRYVLERQTGAPESDSADPLPAIRSFRDQLQARGIRLLVVPVPNKECVYPGMLAKRAEDAGVVVCEQTRRLLDQLEQCGIDHVDLFEVFRRAKREESRSDPKRLYLAHDSHWSTEGARVAAGAVARRVLDGGTVNRGDHAYALRSVTVQRHADLVQMLQVPQIERALEPEILACLQVVQSDTRTPYRDRPESEVLILGDSFLRIYEQDEPGAAGFIAHVARELGQPLSSIVNDGGASTLVRQTLARRPALLSNKKLVIWEFAERDIRYGTEGWQIVPLARSKTTPR